MRTVARGYDAWPMITKRSLPGLWAGLVLAAILLTPETARAEILLPSGFTVRVYVTGDGFETSGGAGGRGIPTTPTLAVDHTGALYLARGGRRHSAGAVDYLQRLDRIPARGAPVPPAAMVPYVPP